MSESPSSETVGSNRLPWKEVLAATGVGIAVIAGGYFVYNHFQSRPAKTVASSVSVETATAKLKADALQLKIKGNKFFKGEKYDKAIESYTEAIALCPPECKAELATFYQNRATAYQKLGQLNLCIEDCNKALEHDPKYVKVFSRRAKVYYDLGRLEESMLDVTVALLFERYKNEVNIHLMEEVVKKLSAKKAQERYATRERSLPSRTFIVGYLSSFMNDPATADYQAIRVQLCKQSIEERKKNKANGQEKILEVSAGESFSAAAAASVTATSNAPPKDSPVANPADLPKMQPTKLEDRMEVSTATFFKEAQPLDVDVAILAADEPVDIPPAPPLPSLTPAVEVVPEIAPLSPEAGDPPLKDDHNQGSPHSNNSDSNSNNGFEKLSVSQVQSGYKSACEAVADERFEQVIDYCNKEIDENGGGEQSSEALVLRATFKMFSGDNHGAEKDIQTVMSRDNITSKLLANALIKRATVRVHAGDEEKAMNYFHSAQRSDPLNCDVYLHRGQLYLLTNKLEEAMGDFKKCIDLNPDFPIGHVQKLFADYKLAMMVARFDPGRIYSLKGEFEKLLRKFPSCIEALTLYAQLLCDINEFGEAKEVYQKVLQVDSKYEVAYVHLGVMELAVSQNMDKAFELMEKAMELDPKAELAYETVAGLEMQRGNQERAIEMFQKAIDLCKSEAEMAHLYALLVVSEAQIEACRRHDINLQEAMAEVAHAQSMLQGYAS